jgi:hypothetical protein
MRHSRSGCCRNTPKFEPMSSQSWYVRPRVAAFSHDICPQIQAALLITSNFWIRKVLRQQNTFLVARRSRYERNTNSDSSSVFGLTLLRHSLQGSRGGLTGRIKGSIVYRMGTRSFSANQLAALSALIATPATKAKASITLSGNLLKVIDSLAGAAQRSAWIERAVQSYAARQLKERRRERELVLLNRHADALNAEGDDSASYQANWTAE